ncbi:hypothetical protein F5Y12DRAFT_713952 [Xylaria sp. FL1777]|nr:hypothetical protein F5Y12DRAFT_713952 [Xylaria sp. FL1777]
MAFTASDVCKIIFAIILPPLGVFLERGCGADLLINILLTILGYIPGIIHALYVHTDQTSPPTYPILLRSSKRSIPPPHNRASTKPFLPPPTKHESGYD